MFSKSYNKDKQKENLKKKLKIITKLRSLNGDQKTSVGVFPFTL